MNIIIISSIFQLIWVLRELFKTGLKYAYQKGYDYALQFDADGQHLPEYIDKMVMKIQEGYDIVIGSRFVEEKETCNNAHAWE